MDSIDLTIDNILACIDEVLSGQLDDASSEEAILSMLQGIYRLTYDIYKLKGKKIPLFTSEEIYKLGVAFREENDAISTNKRVVKMSHLLVLLKIVDPEAAEVLKTAISYTVSK